MKDLKDTPQYKYQKNIINQMCDNLEKSSKVPFMTTPEKSVEKKWPTKFLNAGTEKGLGDLSMMIGVVSEILEAERQKRDEVVEEAVKQERDRIAALCYQLPNDGEEMYQLIFNPPITSSMTNNNLRKIVYKASSGTWTASFYSNEIVVDGQKTREPDVKITARSYDELIDKINKL